MTSFIDCLIKRIEKQQMTGPVRPLQKAVTVLMLHYLQEFLIFGTGTVRKPRLHKISLSLTHTHTRTNTHAHTHTNLEIYCGGENKK